MMEQQTPVMETSAAQPVRSTPPAQPQKPPKKKRKMSKAGKRLVTAIIIAAIVVVVAIVLYLVVFQEKDTKGAPMTQEVMRSSIQSIVEGSGMTKAKDSATITPASGGKILELYVKEGDQVTEGQQLYRMDDTEAMNAVTEAQKTVDNCAKELQAIYDKTKDLTIVAPHAGNLREVGGFKVGDKVSEGTTIATLVNDTKLKLSLYYSYAYEGEIRVGQTAQISIPATMNTRTGTVETINKVRYVTPEGSIHFEVVFVLDNPGTLTEGMDATAAITAADGSAIYPYESGKLKYYETTEIKAKTTGPVEQVNLLNYADVKAGQLLVQLGAEDNAAEIAAKENALKAAQEKLDEATKNLGTFNAVAPIAGTVLSCNLTEGTEVQSGQGITIADTSVMTVEISVDERNVRYVKPGMMVDIDQYGTPYMGVVESVSQTANAENGVAVFPAVVKVDNPDGLLLSNMYVSYKFVASESENCLVVPVQAVKYVTLPDGSGTGGDGMTDGEVPADGDMMTDSDMIVDGEMGVVEAEPQSYSGGAYAKPLMAVSVNGGSVVISDGSSSMASGGSTGGTGGQEATVVFVQTDTPPANAVEADPSWECPEGFVPVVVEVGLADNVNVEIKSGLNEGDLVFIGYETQSADSFG